MVSSIPLANKVMTPGNYRLTLIYGLTEICGIMEI